MTQSGVSQQIAKLEDQLGVRLFNRFGRNVFLSSAGEKLVIYVKKHLEFVDILFEDVHEKYDSLEGLVVCNMPSSCISSVYFSMLLDRRRKHPELDLKVEFLPNDNIFQSILVGNTDFGLITEKVMNPHLSYTLFCQEEYIMVSANLTSLDAVESVNILSEKFVLYPGMDVHFKLWVKHYFRGLKNIDVRSIDKSSECNSINGAIKMVLSGLGLSIFPRHCVQSYIEDGLLFESVSPDNVQLFNEIHIVQLTNHQYSFRVRQVIQWLLDMKLH